MYNIRWGVLLQRIGVQQLSKITLCVRPLLSSFAEVLPTFVAGFTMQG